MTIIGLIKEGKIPADNRVALTPAQCKWIHLNRPDIRVIVEASESRCFKDDEYRAAGIEVKDSVAEANILMGIKEVPVNMLIPHKTYLFFSHTKKLQPYNQQMLQQMVAKKITLIDYECLEHTDGTRIIGFGFFAGVVGAHNGIMAYGTRTGAYHLDRVNANKNFQHLVHTYFGLKLPPIRVAVTGSGRVAHGVLEIMNLLGIHEVEPDQYLSRTFDYPVYVHLKGADLYAPLDGHKYNRAEFHAQPNTYKCLFPEYLSFTDILMNGVYWEEGVPRLFDMDDISKPGFAIQTIADITDDAHGSVPCNLGDSTIADPVYGVDKKSLEKTAPYLPGSIDIMAVGNLPNEMPRDASRYFGEQLIKHVLEGMLSGDEQIAKATILQEGKLQENYGYMAAYAGV